MGVTARSGIVARKLAPINITHPELWIKTRCFGMNHQHGTAEVLRGTEIDWTPKKKIAKLELIEGEDPYEMDTSSQIKHYHSQQ